MKLKRTGITLSGLIMILCLVFNGCGGGTATTALDPTTNTPGKTTAPASTTAAATTTAAITPTQTTTAAVITTTSSTTTVLPPTMTTGTPTITTTPPATAEPAVFTLTSTAFTEGQPIPRIHSYNGGNKSPEMDWYGKPEGTVSFVLIMEDPDGGNWSHWIIFNLGADIEGLGEDQPKFAMLGDNVKQGTNDFGGIGYGGPTPPSGVHHYYFRLYALDTMLDLPSGATRTQVWNAIQGHITGQAELMGTYSAN